MYSYFCSQGCYNDFANTHIQQITAIAPRLEPLETPIDVVKEIVDGGYWNGTERTVIKTVDN